MKVSTLMAGAALAAVGFTSANAGTVYYNPSVFYGDCSFNTTCAASVGRGDDYALQAFTLTAPDVLTGAGFNELDFGTGPTSVNWGIIAADGIGGAPGTILTAGSNDVERVQNLGSQYGYQLNQERFRLGTVALAAGTYYLAVQAVTSTFYDYLTQGVNDTGAFETQDGGSTFTPTYEGIGGVSTIIFDNNSGVPEPSAWALMLVGFGGLGVALRRRNSAAAV